MIKRLLDLLLWRLRGTRYKAKGVFSRSPVFPNGIHEMFGCYGFVVSRDAYATDAWFFTDLVRAGHITDDMAGKTQRLHARYCRNKECLKGTHKNTPNEWIMLDPTMKGHWHLSVIGGINDKPVWTWHRIEREDALNIKRNILSAASAMGNLLSDPIDVEQFDVKELPHGAYPGRGMLSKGSVKKMSKKRGSEKGADFTIEDEAGDPD